jgi:hypothetical protein
MAKLHPIIEGLLFWAWEHGTHETRWEEVLDLAPVKHHELKMAYHEKYKKDKK